ncbi:MAG: hypothetical protein D6743_00940 [Calditrichaeota bacterium]|nr:MAG: hypothetical protein D6743_00940 [Calditrichota bacterium]
MIVTNYGQIGGDRGQGTVWPGTEKEGRIAEYINRGGWFFGGIVPADSSNSSSNAGLDTLVSEGTAAWSVVDFPEMFPHYPDERSAIQVRSRDPNSPFFSPDAVSDEDFISVYTDTFNVSGNFPFVPPKHRRPLGIEVVEKSYQFSDSFAADLVFFDLVIRNVGQNHIRNFYVGLFVDDDIGCLFSNTFTDREDAVGFMRVNAFGDTVNTAWILNTDGDEGCVAGTVGLRILRPTRRIAFNWWSSDVDVFSRDDWGPTTPDVYTGRPNTDDPVGSPVYDSEKYRLLSNGSIDYPQFDLQKNEFDPRIPPGFPNDPSRFLLSAGPLGTRDSTISDPSDEMFGQTVKMFAPGDSVQFTLAIIGGEGDSSKAKTQGTFDPHAFVDLGRNSVIASSLFDTPGVDTDGDGFAGRDVDGDGIPDRGDGVPDFKGPEPPPSPRLTVFQQNRQVTLDWSAADPQRPGYDATDPTQPFNHINPFLSDDPATEFDERLDFEGFRVLRSESGEPGTFEVLAEFDLPHNDFGRNTGLSFRYDDHASDGSVFYYAVVSFSRGEPEIGLESRQSSPFSNLTRVVVSSQPSTGFTQKIWVEPNPYMEGQGLESTLGRGTALDFVNVPTRCTIRIFTPDGDHVQTLVHDDPHSSRARWDLRNKGGRRVAPGLYIFSVEIPAGERREGRFLVLR